MEIHRRQEMVPHTRAPICRSGIASNAWSERTPSVEARGPNQVMQRTSGMRVLTRHQPPRFNRRRWRPDNVPSRSVPFYGIRRGILRGCAVFLCVAFASARWNTEGACAVASEWHLHRATAGMGARFDRTADEIWGKQKRTHTRGHGSAVARVPCYWAHAIRTSCFSVHFAQAPCG